MERTVWLKKMRAQSEALYDHIAPAYWVKFGLYPDTAHHQYLSKFLGMWGAQSSILDAACGAGRYDGMLLAAGHRVLGIDQSAGMLARAREHFPPEQFPQVSYEKIGLQQMDFHEEFDGAICMDALEHICPEDWPGILGRFHVALKPGGPLYFTADVREAAEIETANRHALAMGLPVVYGEIADDVDAARAAKWWISACTIFAHPWSRCAPG